MAQYESIRDIEMTSTPSKSTLPRYEAVHDTDTPSDANLISDQPALPRRLPSPRRNARARGSIWWRRIGLSGLLILVVGTKIMLASCGVLIFLWSGTKAAINRDESRFWQMIVTRGWASRVVTICSAALRTSMRLHIGLIAAAAAATILETTGVLLVDAPALSIERATGASPVNILPATLRRCIAGKGSGLLHLLILTTTLSVALVSTFTSTILLSDFSTVKVQGPVTTNITPLDTDETDQFWRTTSYWRYSPSAQWRFAEEKSDEPWNSPSETDQTYRAMLPFPGAESRESLEYYEGPAVVANFRTMCKTPFMYNVSFEREQGKLYVKFSEMLVSAGPSKRVDNTDTIKALLIDCSSSSSTWPISLYTNPDPKPGGTLMITTPGPPKNSSFETRSVFHSVFLFNATFLRNINGTKARDAMLEDTRGLKVEQGEVWTKVSHRDGTELISATNCLVNVAAPNTHHVKMHGRAIESEPLGDWRRIKNDTMIRHQFGVGVLLSDFDRRGILQLEIGDPVTTGKVPGEDDLPPFNLLLNGSLKDSSSSVKGAWALSDDLDSLHCFEDWSAHAMHAAIFQEIIQATKKPALAVQALMTRLYQMAYYDWLEGFHVEYDVKTIHATGVLIPDRWDGLAIVLGLVSLHLVLLFITIVLFATQTRSSVLGNAWLAVAQMVSPRTREIIESADGMKDKEVDRCIRATGHAEIYRISNSSDGDRVEIQRR